MAEQRPLIVDIAPHLTVVPSGPAELLFVDFGGYRPSSPNMAVLENELFEADSAAIMMASLGAAGLILSVEAVPGLRRELKAPQGPNEARRTTIEAALARQRAAGALINKTIGDFTGNFTTAVDAATEKGMARRVLDHSQYDRLLARTARVSGATPIKVVTNLKDAAKRKVIAEEDRLEAERSMLLLYDRALQDRERHA